MENYLVIPFSCFSDLPAASGSCSAGAVASLFSYSGCPISAGISVGSVFWLDYAVAADISK